MGHWHSLGVPRLWCYIEAGGSRGLQESIPGTKHNVPSAVRKLQWSDSCNKHPVPWRHRGLWICEVLGHDTGVTLPQLTILARALGAM